MISVLVANAKGGCGKTTIATNLAAAYASRGFDTWLIDADRQKSALGWAKARPGDRPVITAKAWKEGMDLPDGPGARVIFDAPAGVRTKAFATLLRECDLAIVPVLPSGFDIAATERMLTRVEDLKPVRKGRKPLAVVMNRYRASSRSGKALLARLTETGRDPIARIADRAVYPDLAGTGLGLFELGGARNRKITEEWKPLIRFIEEFAGD
jgi:chromosome partitioning protein